ncbi:hypothetical protein Tco_1292553 [Tanacetum coccineum]
MKMNLNASELDCVKGCGNVLDMVEDKLVSKNDESLSILLEKKTTCIMLQWIRFKQIAKAQTAYSSGGTTEVPPPVVLNTGKANNVGATSETTSNVSFDACDATTADSGVMQHTLTTYQACHHSIPELEFEWQLLMTTGRSERTAAVEDAAMMACIMAAVIVMVKGFAAALAVLVTGASQSRQHESHHRFFPVDTSLIHIESRKSPTKSLFDVGSRRISIFTVNTKEYHSDVLAIITRIMRRT